jgi:hypothetical protein
MLCRNYEMEDLLVKVMRNYYLDWDPQPTK